MKNATMSYKDAMRAAKDEAIAEQTGKFYEMAPKSSNVWGPVSTAPAFTAEPAKQVERFSGKGGYEYGQLPDGSFVILKSGRGAAPGTVVKEGTRGYDAIKQEFEDVKAGKPVSSKPRSVASKSAPKSEAPKPRISLTGPTEYERTKARVAATPYESFEDPRMGESDEDERMGETVSRTPEELKSSRVYGAAALATRAMNALVREGTDPMAASKIVQGLKQSGNMASLEGLARLRK